MIVLQLACAMNEATMMEEIPDRFVELSLEAEPEAVMQKKQDIAANKDGLLMIEGNAMKGVGGLGSRGGGVGGGGEAAWGRAEAPLGMALPSPPAPPADDAAAEATLREWFPEAFLWSPSVRTDASGTAELDVRVPDQLTTWRVLALAHDDQGQQTGSVHTFDSTLPAYLDPVVPGWSYVGDRFRLPVQVVNNSAAPLTGRLTVDLEGAIRGGTSSDLSLGGFGASTRALDVEAVSAGQGTLSARLGSVDNVKRSWTVTPVGRPVVELRGGSLSGERIVDLKWPEGSDPRTARFSVEVQPGPLAVVAAELDRIDNGGRWGHAYAYGVLKHLSALHQAAGTEMRTDTLRRVKKRAWQRLVRRARSADAMEAASLLEGFEPDGTLEAPLHGQLVRTLLAAQRADGSFARGSRDDIQQVLVTTANCGRILPEDETGARLRASGALERFRPNVDDAYTAAVVLASGLYAPDEAFEKLLLDGLIEIERGGKTFAAPANVRSPWGARPTHREAKAWMVLALLRLGGDEHKVLAGDLASELMTSYGRTTGFASGHADSLLLEAIVRALPTVSDPLRLSLALDGTEIASASLDPKAPSVSAVMEGVPAGVDPARLTLTSAPVGAGLSYTLTQRSWVPWTGREALGGVEVELEQGRLRTGQKGTLTYTIAGPSRTRVTVVQGLPAGMVVHEPDKVRARADVSSLEVEQDHITLVTKPFGAGEILTIPITVIPRYAGRMRTAPTEISASNTSVLRAPHLWTVD